MLLLEEKKVNKLNQNMINIINANIWMLVTQSRLNGSTNCYGWKGNIFITFWLHYVKRDGGSKIYYSHWKNC